MSEVENLKEEDIRKLLETIPDPEVPAISIVDLGVVRKIVLSNNHVEVSITPTYSGCPALKVMEDDIRRVLEEKGFKVSIKTVFKPAWTTEWMSDATLMKLKEYGIAPPQKMTFEQFHPLNGPSRDPVPCPFCDSKNTTLTSQFGSTACKALYFCNSCHQPFEHFKCH